MILGFKCKTIQIDFVFPDGKQASEHPNPGTPYYGERRRCFLPNNTEGKKVLKLVKVAWKRKLMFTIGYSETRGVDDVIIWNGIEMKTNIKGGRGRYGWPDKSYFKRVLKQLKKKGVRE